MPTARTYASVTGEVTMRQGHSRQAKELLTFCRLMKLRRVITAFYLGLATIAASPLTRNNQTRKGGLQA